MTREFPQRSAARQTHPYVSRQQDGSVLVAGGAFNSECSDAADILSVHIYDPLKNVWTAVNAPAGWTGIGDAASVNNQRNE